ncbi:MAG: tetratricopeptide repeat protein [Ignavibacteriae bacterium]|nr:tetratricopeptide repeat protein [Ignavibacteriota bacterium]
MTPYDPTGKVITFYSYKGGTGRSMALANVACLLAQRSDVHRGVLMIDWDLEAPGLHRFFHDRFTRRFPASSLANGEKDFAQAPGLIDFFVELEARVREATSDGKPQSEPQSDELMAKVDLRKYAIETDVPSLSLMKAGAFDQSYSRRVTTFNWEDLYNRSPYIMQAFAERLARDYSFVLIDSRTGISDASGICTMLLPEKLVVVFTPNRQSLMGVDDIVQRATEYRRQSDDLRPLIVFPLPSRIDLSEKELQAWWRSNMQSPDVLAYEPLFQRMFENVYGLKHCDLAAYFDEVRIQHFPFYSYGEKIAVLQKGESDRLSLARSYATFTTWLVDRPCPWKEEVPVQVPTATADEVKLAETAFARLSSDEQKTLQRIFLRLVRIAESGERENANRGLKARISDFDRSSLPLVRSLQEERLLIVEADKVSGEETVQIASDGLIDAWPRLKTWLKEDRDFLVWRQQLRTNMAQWEKSKDHGALLSGAPLGEAQRWLASRGSDLSASEHEYIVGSANVVRKGKLNTWLALLGFFIIVAGIALWQYFRTQREQAEFSNVLSDGYSLYKNGQLDSAIVRFGDGIAMRDQSAEAYYARGSALLSKRDYKKAAADFSQALQRKPDYADALNDRGVASLNLGDTTQAIRDFEKAIEVSPNSALPYTNRGMIYYREQNYSKALEFQAKAVSLNQNSWVSYIERGNAYLELKDTAKALQDYGHAIDLQPDSALGYYNRGVVYRASGAYDLALAELARALELKPGYAEAYMNRAIIYFKRRSRQAAIDEANRALQLAADSVLIREANDSLRSWGAAAPIRIPTAQVTRVFVHYNDRRDSLLVLRVNFALAGRFKVQPSQVVTQRTFGDVRYYYDADKSNAEAVRRLVQKTLMGEGIALSIQLLYLGESYAQNIRVNAMRRLPAMGTIEVWLPSLRDYQSMQMAK